MGKPSSAVLDILANVLVALEIKKKDQLLENGVQAFSGSKKADGVSDIQFESLYHSHYPHHNALAIVLDVDKPDKVWAKIIPILRNIHIDNETFSEIFRKVAFRCAFHVKPYLMANAAVAFHFKEKPQIFLQILHTRFGKKDYRKVSEWALFLELDPFFIMNNFLLPTMYKQKLSEVLHLFNDKMLETFIDHINYMYDNCGTDEFYSTLRDFNISEINSKLINRGFYQAIGKSIIKKFKFDKEVFPFVAQGQKFSALNYIMRKYVKEHHLNFQDWVDLISEHVQGDRGLQTTLVRKLIQLNELDLACFHFNLHNLSLDSFFGSYKEILRDHKQVTAKLLEYDTTTTDKFYQFPLNYEDIHIVADKPLLLDAIQCLKAHPIIGFDCEWKPVLSGNHVDPSIVQIATSNNVYIFDMKTLRTTMGEEPAELLVTGIFANNEIKKLGYSVKEDFITLSRSYKCFEGYPKFCNVVDLLPLSQHFIKLTSNDTVTDSSGSKARGLARLVEHYFSKPLNKRQQCSNWDRRPLNDGQIVYAATDALVLIELYDVFAKQCVNLDIKSPEELLAKIPPKVKKSKVKAEPISNQCSSKVNSQIDIKKPSLPYMKSCDVRVIVDDMIGGLGKQLRLINMDCVVATSPMTTREIIDLAFKEKRHIISRGKRFKMFQANYRPNMCFELKTDNMTSMMKEVCSHFNVKVAKEDLFQRCLICNCPDFYVVPREIFLYLTQQAPLQFKESYQNIIFGLQKCSCDPYSLPFKVLQYFHEFMVCKMCGKIYWDGSHRARAVENSLSEILNFNRC